MPAASSPVPWTPPRGLMALAALAFLGVAAAYVFPIVFSRSLSPDEGYLMITIQSFIEGHALYDSVFTQYGPFYYIYEWFVRVLLAVPLTHDATRLLCLFHWLAAAAILGFAAKILTRSAWAGAFVFMQAVVHLTTLANEPGHPQELVVGLLALGTWVAAGIAPGSSRLSLLALLAALLAFTKINVGIFFGIACLLTLRCESKDRLSGRAWTWLLTGAIAVLPLLLMRRHLAAEWCRNYSLVTAGTVTAVFLLAPSMSEKRVVGLAEYFKIAAFLLVPSALLLGLAVGTGTSPRGLVDGLLLTPLKMAGVALLPLPLSRAVLVNAAVSLALAFTLAIRSRPPGPSWGIVLVVLKIFLGIAGAWLFLGQAKVQIAWLLPWVWLVLIPTAPHPTFPAREKFPRVFLALAAAWQGLQAYPIAGTQVTTATFLLLLAYTLCLSDAWKAVSAWDPLPTLRERLAGVAPGQWRLAQVLGLVAMLYVFANVWCRLGEVRREYANLPALDLPGSHLVHLDAETREMYRELAAYLEKECDTFVTYPGINSLYFWTGKRPPTHLNSTGWGQLSHAQQEHILTGLRQSSRPLLVVVAAAAQSWNNGAPAPILPLVRCVTEDCREVHRIGRFILYLPKPAAETAQRE